MKPIHLSGALGVFSRRPMADGGSTTPKDNPVLRGMFGGLPPEQDAALRKRMLESITPAEGSYMASVRDRIQDLAGAAGDKAQSVADSVANRVQGVIDAVKQKKGELTWPEGTPFNMDDYRQEMRNVLQNYQNQAADFIPSRVRTWSSPQGRAGIAQNLVASLQDPVNAVNLIGAGGMAGTFAGVGAKTADLGALAKAREMLANGATDREAWAATGWTHAFPDGKPRFEISDDRAVFNTPDKLQARYEELMQRNDQIRQQLAETQPKNWGPDLFQRQLTDARNAIKNEHTQNIINSQQLTGATNLGVMGGTIAPVAYEHPELYKAYPELADIRVKQGVYPENPQVLGYHQGPEIGIGQGALDRPAPPGAVSQPASTMGHEMQHSVQDIEGFARGTMPAQAKYDWEQDMGKQLAALEASKAEVLKGRDPYQLMNKRNMFGGLSPEEDLALQKWGDINDRLFDLQQQTFSVDPNDLYKRHAGEVEARLTQNSMLMTPEQRAASYPLDRMDVPPEQQIVRFNRTTDNPAAAPSVPRTPKGPALTDAEAAERKDLIGKTWQNGYTLTPEERSRLDALNNKFDASNRLSMANIASKEGPAALNIGLNAGDIANGVNPITQDAVLAAIKKNGGEVTGTAVHQSATEPTLVATLKKPMSDEAMHQLAIDTQQEAIPQLKADGTGKLHGPAAEKWGDFNPDYFITPNGKPLSEAPITMDVMGQHYSREPHDVLSGTYFGRGAKSEESARLAQADDPRLRQRINAYVDEGKGVVPEGDVGNVRHDVPMTGLYNIKDDPFNLRRTVYSDDPVKQANTMESRIVDAGFPGYYAPQLLRNGDMGHAVLLGDASKNVKPAAINGKPMSLSMASNPPSMPRPEPGGLWHETPTPYNPDLPVQFTLPGGEKGSARVLGDVPEGARISSFSMADMPTSKADLVAAGYYHPIGAGLKLRTPYPELNATQVPIKDLPPHNIISPEDLLGGVLVPAIGDRTAAGAMLTHIGGQELAKPTLLEGGPDFMRTHMGEGAAWAANKSPAIGLSRLIRQAAELGGGDVYMPYVAMSPTAGDFSTMMSSSLLNQARTAPIAKKYIKAFDDSLSAQRPEWPGLHSPDAETALSQNGELRKAFVQEMAKTQHADRGFPDVPATRFGITEPSLLDVPTGASGFSIARMDPSGRIIENPTTPHSSYGTQLAGTFMGGLDQSIPREVMFPNWYASRRAAGAPEAADPYSFMRNPPIQPVDESWVNDVQSYLANRPDQNYAEGGIVSKEHNFPDGATVQLRDYKGDPQEYNIAPGSYSPTELADHLILQGAHAETALHAAGAHDHPLLNQ